MKTLTEYINECDSISDAARRLKKPTVSVFDWFKSKKKHFVVELNGELKVLAVK